MNRKKILFSLFLLALALPLLVLPANAGGWATVGITQMPEELVAERPFTLEFMVWQHGNKPVHELNWGDGESRPIEPLISLGSADAGEKLTFKARPAKELGLFTAEITLPAEGEWFLSIDPNPLGGITEFDSLTVLPRSAAPAAGLFNRGQSFPPLLSNSTAVFTFAAGILLAILIIAYRAYQGKQAG
jgi:hypothetical protein